LTEFVSTWNAKKEIYNADSNALRVFRIKNCSHSFLIPLSPTPVLFH